MSPHRLLPVLLIACACAGFVASAAEQPRAAAPAAAPAESGPADPPALRGVAPAPEPPAGEPGQLAAPQEAPTPAAAPPKPRPVPAPVRVSQDPRPTLAPETFIATLRAAERHLAIAEAGGWPSLPPGTALKAGDKGPLVALLRQRLAASEDLAAEHRQGEAYDAPVAAAVKRFQVRHGLPETGTVGPRTLEALNVPAEARFRQLSRSALRLSGSSFPFGERYVVVNIPSATVEAVEQGQVARRYVAVAGKKDRPSPTVETRITAVNLNPTWTVPVSIIRKDIIPRMRREPDYLAKAKIRILDGQGREVDPAAVDWSTERAVNYTLRQDTGEDNSLGLLRIDMPNRHAVYMHDTPTKRLFAQAERFHSSGCVRIADVRALAAWLLEGAAGPNGAWTAAEIDAAIAAGQRQDVKLAKPVPISWIYMTGYATPDGTAHFRDDVYGLDRDATAPDPVTSTSSIPGRTF